MDTMVSPIVSRSQSHEFMNKLESAGLIGSLAQKVIDSKDNELAKKVVRLIENGGFELSTSQKRAREIMGRNFFGIEEAIKHFGVNPSRQQLAYLAEIPFSEPVLKACQKTHILVAVFSLSILDVRGKAAASVKLPDGQRMFYDQDWYNKQAFAKERGEIGWHLVRKTPVANSTSKNWQDQQALLDKTEETPRARVMVYTIIGHFLAIGERLFEKVYVRCMDVGSDGDRVYVGIFDAGGLIVNNYWDEGPDDRIGLASARKSE